MDPHNDEAFASPEALKYWSPVDWYNGGMEHTTLHLLYSRFWHKFLFDQGLCPPRNPMPSAPATGMILGENGEKMSKSRGNVVNPDDIVNEYGADTMRLYEMFIGDFEKAAPWSNAGIKAAAAWWSAIGTSRISSAGRRASAPTWRALSTRPLRRSARTPRC